MPITGNPALARCPVPRWVIYCSACAFAWLLYAYVDRPASTWMLAHNEQLPWATIRSILRPFGAGGAQLAILLVVTVLGLWLGKPKIARAGKWILLAFLITVALTTALKWAVRRPRPGHMDAPRPTLPVQIDSSEWHSFPSGDVAATTSIVVARHFPADIVAGAMLGAWVGQQTVRRIPPYREWRSVPRRKAKVVANEPA